MTTITATPLPDATPAPRILVEVDDIDVAAATLTLFRQAEGRTHRVRGAVRVPVAGGFATLDIEAPFGVETGYRVELFTAGGLSLGFSDTTLTQLDVDLCWVHNPMDPAGSTQLDLSDTSGRALTRTTSGEMFHPEQRVVGMLISGTRRGLEGVPLFFSTDEPQAAARFEAMLGGYAEADADVVPILCIRTPPLMDIPRTFYAAVMQATRKPINVHMGGTLREWEAEADEAAPPAPGLVVPLLTRNDIDAFFATRSALDAAYGARLDIDRDYSKAGYST